MLRTEVKSHWSSSPSSLLPTPLCTEHPINFDASTAEPLFVETVQPTLSTGSRLLLLGESGDPARSAIVVRVSDGLIWISGTDDPGQAGDQVRMIFAIPGDAQYQAPARVELVPPETLALRRIGAWRRLQRRTQVRLTTHGVQLEIERPARGDAPATREKLTMIDVSAGGAGARGFSALSSGDEVRCDFRLPGRGVFQLGARVVRIQPKGKGRVVGFEFVGASPEEQAALRRWIYREESRRHRQANERKRKDRGEWKR